MSCRGLARSVIGAGAALIFFALGTASFAAASTVTPVADDTGLIIEGVEPGDFPEVLVTVAVPGGLAAIQNSGDEFSLLENGQPIPVEVVPIDNAENLEVVIVFDRSGSMGNEPMRAAKNAALAFIAALPGEVNIGLVSFSTEAIVDVPISLDRTTLINAVEALDSYGNTSLYDGVIVAATLFNPEIERKVLVVLSDGGDNDSLATLENATAAVAGLSVEMIELATPESNRGALELLAAPLPVRSTEDPAQLEELYTSVAQRLVGRVNLKYTSIATPGSSVSIKVTLGAGDNARSATATFDAPLLPSTTTLPAITIFEKQSESSTAGRILSFLLICGGLLVIAYFVSDRRAKLSRQRLIPQGTDARGSNKRRDVLIGIKQRIENSDRQKQLVADIETLSLKRSPGSVVLLTIGVAVLLGLIITLATNMLFGLIVVFLVLMVARNRLNSRVAKRKTTFIAQLPETLGTLSSMLRTGYGLTQALSAVAEESEEPTKSLLSRVVLEVSTGRDLIEALRVMGAQIGSIDFDWVIAGIEISRETGGDLAKTLETVAATIRERDKLRGQVRSLTAEGRYSSYIMLGLPPGVGTISYLINPTFYSIFSETIGIILLSITATLMAVGYFWMKSMIRKVSL